MARENAIVFFAAPRTARYRLYPFRAARLLYRRPTAAWRMFWIWLLRVITYTEYTHVAIGYRGAVLDPVFAGNRFWPLIGYVVGYPGLYDAFEVPVSGDVPLEDYEGGGPKPVWPTLVRWLTAGVYQTDDCVCVVCGALRKAGVDVPSYIISPGQLHRWLELRRHHHVVFARREDTRDCR